MVYAYFVVNIIRTKVKTRYAYGRSTPRDDYGETPDIGE